MGQRSTARQFLASTMLRNCTGAKYPLRTQHQCSVLRNTHCIPSSSLQVVGIRTTSDLSSSSTEGPCPRMFQPSPQPTAAATYVLSIHLGLVLIRLRGPWDLSTHGSEVPAADGCRSIRCYPYAWDLSSSGSEVPGTCPRMAQRSPQLIAATAYAAIYTPGTCPH